MPKNRMNSPRVSIIMPTYNRAHLITKAINSILGQSFKNFELILVDDGSIDNTENIVKGYRDYRIKYFKIPHAGPPRARNYALRKAQGELITYCDDDCIYYRNHIQKLVDFIDSHPEIGLAYSNGKNVMPSGAAYALNREFDKRRLETLCLFFLFNVMHRKECLDKSGLFDERLLAKSDWDLWLRISDAYGIAYIPIITAKHIHYPGTTTVTALGNKDIYTEEIIKKRIKNAIKNKRLAEYLNDCSLGIIRNLIAHGNIKYACLLTEKIRSHYKLKNYQTDACLGLCYLAKKKYKQAVLLFKQSMQNLSSDWHKLDSWHTENIVDIKSYLARTYYLQGRLLLAQKACNEILTVHPDHFETKIQLAECYTRRKRFNDALKMLVFSKLGYWRYNPQAYNLRGCCYFKNKKYALAIREFKNAIAIDPRTAFYHSNLTLAYTAINEHAKAKSERQTALRLETVNLKAKYSPGDAQIKSGKNAI